MFVSSSLSRASHGPAPGSLPVGNAVHTSHPMPENRPAYDAFAGEINGGMRLEALLQSLRNANAGIVSAAVESEVPRPAQGGRESSPRMLAPAAVHGNGGAMAVQARGQLDADLLRTVLDDQGDVAAALLQCGANANYANGSGTSVLMLAARHGHSRALQALLQAGADRHAVDRWGNTALAYAAHGGHLGVVHALAQGAAGLDAGLLAAARSGDAAAVGTLVRAGASPDAVGAAGRPALFDAAYGGDCGMADALIEAGAHVDFVGPEGETPLMMAACQGHAGVVGRLLRAGAPIDAADDAGFTALMFAARWGHAGAVRMLLESGATIDLPERNGASALILAQAFGHVDARNLLVQAAAHRQALDALGLAATAGIEAHRDERAGAPRIGP